MLSNNKIFIIGGSGSLGNELIKRYLKNNNIICYSRDECKHWKMALKYKSNNLKFIIGDIRDYNRLETSILRELPDYIIIAAALKHIDKCENSINECILTNLIGVQNVLNVAEAQKNNLQNLKTICLISTDKACSPVNVYGMCKALSEKLITEKSFFIKDIKFVCVRYGNVLNSRGSIIPILHDQGKDPDIKEFSLTSEYMTRFVMTLEQSINLIEHAILYAESGDVVIPKLISMNVKDLVEIFSEIYKKPIKIIGIRPGEKILESLINETQSMRLVISDQYIYIKPTHSNKIITNDFPKDYNSYINPLNKEELFNLLNDLKLI